MTLSLQSDYGPVDKIGRGPILASTLLFGFSSLIVQLLMFRELTITFYEFELFLGISLAIWLLAVAAGGFIGGALVQRVKKARLVLGTAHCGIALLSPIMIYLARIVQARHFGKNGWLSVSEIIIYTALLLGPFCLTVGTHFALCSKLYQRRDGFKEKGFGNIYLTEGLGALAGSLVFGFILLPFFQPFVIAFILALVNLAFTSFLFLKPPAHKNILGKLSLIFFAIFLIATLSGIPISLEGQSTQQRWESSYDVIFTKMSKYGDVEVLRDKDDGSLDFLVNRMLMFSTGASLIHNESLAHLSLLQHANPKKVLLIGGGVGGALKEILKHPVSEVVFIEIDPLVIDVAKSFFPRTSGEAFKDARVNIVNADGRLFVKRTKEKFDIVMVDFADPYVSQMVRFYTFDFFREVKQILSPDGILTMQCLSPGEREWLKGIHWDGVGPGVENISRCILKTMRAVFPEVVVIPGHYDFFLGLKSPHKERLNTTELLNRYSTRKINAQRIIPAYLKKLFDPDFRTKNLAHLQDTHQVNINTDSRPIMSWYDLDYWQKRWYQGISLFQRVARGLRLWWFLLPTLVIAGAFGFRRYLRRDTIPKGSLIPYIIFTTGSGTMALEIVLIWMLCTQYGYRIDLIGLLFAGYMLGMVTGSFFARRGLDQNKNPYRILRLLEVVFLIAAFLVPLLGAYMVNFILATFLYRMIPCAFALLIASVGFLGGAEFVTGVNIYHADHGDKGKCAGRIYGYELLGASLVGLFAGIALIPVLGLNGTCYAIGLLKLSSLALLI
ncbi:fused MFS/spermidine synthase, partial [Candidatus Omnitrophota bacterium]